MHRCEMRNFSIGAWISAGRSIGIGRSCRGCSWPPAGSPRTGSVGSAAVSSRRVRELLAEGRDVGELIPPEVRPLLR